MVAPEICESILSRRVVLYVSAAAFAEYKITDKSRINSLLIIMGYYFLAQFKGLRAKLQIIVDIYNHSLISPKFVQAVMSFI